MGEVRRQDIQRSNIVNPLTALQKDLPKCNRADKNYGSVHVLRLVQADHRFAKISGRLCCQIQMRNYTVQEADHRKETTRRTRQVERRGKSGRIAIAIVTPTNVVQTGVKRTQAIVDKIPLSGVTANILPENNTLNGTALSADAPINSVDSNTPANAAMEGVTQACLIADTNTVSSPNMNLTKEPSDLTTHAALVTAGNTGDNKNETALPNLAIDREHAPAIPALPPVINNKKELIMPDNASEFNFSPLSSEKDNESKIPDQPESNLAASVPNAMPRQDNEHVETALTEEEDEAVSALLSLSKSIPSESSQDSLDNSELLPMGKKMVNAVPVPIHLSTDDVNKEITKLKLPTENEDDVQTKVPSTGVTTTTIFTNAAGTMLSTSYKLKKKGTKTCKFVYRSCGAVKPSIQDLNDHHKRKHEEVMCGTCNKLFDAPFQLVRHMYEHSEKNIQCECCDRCFTFQSELEKDKVIHRKNPSVQMHEG